MAKNEYPIRFVARQSEQRIDMMTKSTMKSSTITYVSGLGCVSRAPPPPKKQHERHGSGERGREERGGSRRRGAARPPDSLRPMRGASALTLRLVAAKKDENGERAPSRPRRVPPPPPLPQARTEIPMPSAPTVTGSHSMRLKESHGSGSPTSTSKMFEPIDDETAISPNPARATIMLRNNNSSKLHRDKNPGEHAEDRGNKASRAPGRGARGGQC